MYDHEPTMRSRYVGQKLLRASHKAGYNGNDMAKLLGWSPSKVSRLLSGKRGACSEDVAAYLALCGVTGPERDELLALNAHASEPTWWQDHGTRLPVRFPMLASIEGSATRITWLATTLVPDLLRAPEYTRAVLTAQPSVPDSEIEDRLAETLRRQKVLDRSFGHPDVTVFLAEYALTRPGAGDSVMSDQAHHLLRLAVRPEITIRVIPDDNQMSGLCCVGPFALFRFTEQQPAVYLEHATSTIFLEQPETITTYDDILSRVNKLALSRESSRARIADIARQRAHDTATADTLAIWATS